MASKKIYKSKFLDCWPKIKEIRSTQAKNMWTAHERGELLVWSGPIPYTSFLAGFGKYYSTGGMGPNYTMAMTDPDLLDECMQKVEAEGFNPNMCGMFRTTLGQILANVYDTSLKTGQKIKHDLFFDLHICQGQIKCSQVWAEVYPDIPYFGIETPCSFEHADYLVAQMHETAEAIEKAIGRKYNDEWALEALKNEWQGRVYLARIAELQKTKPAPLNARWMMSISTIGYSKGCMHLPEVTDTFRMAYEETKDRVQNGIAAMPIETCRLTHEGVSSWYPSPVLRYPNSFGANFVLAGQNACGIGAWEPKDDLSFEVAPTLEELQLPLNTRDDIFRAMATLWLKYVRQISTLQYYPRKLEQLLKVVDDWHIDGVVINRAPECRGLSGSSDQIALALKDKGVSVMVYEGSPNTPLDFNQESYLAHMDAFMEGFGLKQIPDFVPVEPPDYIEF